MLQELRGPENVSMSEPMKGLPLCWWEAPAAQESAPSSREGSGAHGKGFARITPSLQRIAVTLTLREARGWLAAGALPSSNGGAPLLPPFSAAGGVYEVSSVP